MKFKIFTLIAGLGVFVAALMFANGETMDSETLFMNWIFTPAEIVDIIEDNTFIDPNHPDDLMGNLLYEVRLSRGERAGEYMEARIHISPMRPLLFEAGDRVIVRYNNYGGDIHSAEIYNWDRSRILIGMIVVFLGVLVALGGKSGVKTVASLVFTMVSLLFILNPLILRGFPAILTTFAVLSFVTVIVLIFIGGLTKKTAVSILSCIFGVLFAALASHIAGWLASINGLNTGEIGTLIMIGDNNGVAIDASGLFISGVLIASLGAVMDTAVSIASSTQELKLANPSMTRSELLKASYAIGKDVMGTMANTLILAFAGSSLNMVLTLSALQIPFAQMINNDFIGVEIIRSLAGSLGIALTVPAAAIIGSFLYSKEPNDPRTEV